MKDILKRVLVVVCLSLVSTAGAAETSNSQGLVLRLSIPLSGNKTTFRFIVENRGTEPTTVYAPFANMTRLLVTRPNGQEEEVFNWKSMAGPPEPLAPGATFQWDVDISNWVEWKNNGEFIVAFRVNGEESNSVTIIKD